MDYFFLYFFCSLFIACPLLFCFYLHIHFMILLVVSTGTGMINKVFFSLFSNLVEVCVLVKRYGRLAKRINSVLSHCSFKMHVLILKCINACITCENSTV
jgi:hypothetical protein